MILKLIKKIYKEHGIDILSEEEILSNLQRKVNELPFYKRWLFNLECTWQYMTHGLKDGE